FFLAFFSTGNQFAIFSDVTPPKLRGTVNSLSGVMTNVGGIVGNLLVSTLIQTNIQMISISIAIVLVIWLFGSILWIIPYYYYPKELRLQKIRANPSKNRIYLSNDPSIA
ncbi:hypothetical protein LCGC14_2605800, partial [marine sediment metagenome]